MQDEQLFGAPAGQVTRVTLEVFQPVAEERMTIRLTAEQSMRNTPATLFVYLDTAISPGPVLGRLAKYLHNGWWWTPATLRAHLWHDHNWFGQEGYDVSINGAGREPTRRR